MPGQPGLPSEYEVSPCHMAALHTQTNKQTCTQTDQTAATQRIFIVG